VICRLDKFYFQMNPANIDFYPWFTKAVTSEVQPPKNPCMHCKGRKIYCLRTGGDTAPCEWVSINLLYKSFISVEPAVAAIVGSEILNARPNHCRQAIGDRREGFLAVGALPSTALRVRLISTMLGMPSNSWLPQHPRLLAIGWPKSDRSCFLTPFFWLVNCEAPLIECCPPVGAAVFAIWLLKSMRIEFKLDIWVTEFDVHSFTNVTVWHLWHSLYTFAKFSSYLYDSTAARRQQLWWLNNLYGQSYKCT